MPGTRERGGQRHREYGVMGELTDNWGDNDGIERGLNALAVALNGVAEAIDRLTVATAIGLPAHGASIEDASQNIADAIRKD